MNDPLIDWLNSLPEGVWSPYEGSDEAVVKELERSFELSFPSGYRDLLLTFGGGVLQGPKSHIHLEPPDVLMWHNLDEAFEERLPGMFVIGDDGGGSAVYFDPRDRLGRGAWAVFLVAFGALGFRDSLPIGRNLMAALQAIAGGLYPHDDIEPYGREPD